MPDLHVDGDGMQTAREALALAGELPASPATDTTVFGSPVVVTALLDVLETLDALTQAVGDEATELAESVTTSSETLAEHDAALARQGGAR